MTIQRMGNVAIVVEDLDAAVAFFTELGMELEGKGQIEGLWADRIVGLDGLRSEIAMIRTPDGQGTTLGTGLNRSPQKGQLVISALLNLAQAIEQKITM